MDGSLPGSSVHGISQAGMMEWVAISLQININAHERVYSGKGGCGGSEMMRSSEFSSQWEVGSVFPPLKLVLASNLLQPKVCRCRNCRTSEARSRSLTVSTCVSWFFFFFAMLPLRTQLPCCEKLTPVASPSWAFCHVREPSWMLLTTFRRTNSASWLFTFRTEAHMFLWVKAAVCNTLLRQPFSLHSAFRTLSSQDAETITG